MLKIVPVRWNPFAIDDKGEQQFRDEIAFFHYFFFFSFALYATTKKR